MDKDVKKMIMFERIALLYSIDYSVSQTKPPHGPLIGEEIMLSTSSWVFISRTLHECRSYITNYPISL